MLFLAAIVIKATMNTCHFIKAYMILLTLQVADVLTAHNWVTVVCNSQLGYSSLFTKGKCILIDFLNLKSIVLHISLILFKDVLPNPVFNSEEVDHDMHNRLTQLLVVKTGTLTTI